MQEVDSQQNEKVPGSQEAVASHGPDTFFIV
jgi:hypothetical protein